MKKIIVSIVSIVVIVCLGVAALVMSFVQVGGNDFSKSPDAVYVFSKSLTSTNRGYLKYSKYDTNPEVAKIIKNIHNKFEDSSKQNYLSAMLNGSLKDKIEEVNYDSSKTISKNYNTEDDKTITIVFEYDDSQSTAKGTKYSYIAFELNGEDERQETVYALATTLSSSSVSTISYKNCYVGKANFKTLYNYVLGLTK